MLTNPAVDVAIIGAGLAGSAAASLLAQAGYRVLLLEAATFPHDKLCGEFLSPECDPLFRRLGVLSAIHAHGPSRITSARVTALDGRAWDTDFPQPALGLSRRALDALLFDHAADRGATVLAGARVTRVEAEGETTRLVWQGQTGPGEARARLVLGAWGKRSGLDRALARPFLDQSFPTFALKAHYHGPALGRRVELHGFAGGYCGLAEIEAGRINLCLLAETRLLKEHGGDPDRFAQAVLPTNPALGAWLSHATRLYDRFIAISQIPFVPKRQVENGILLIGDAAGLISPLAGNGMAMALASAELAAPLVLQFLTGGLDRATLETEYTRRWQTRFRQRLWLGRLVQPLLFHPPSLSLGLRVLRLLPALGKVIVDRTRDPIGQQGLEIGD